MMKNLLIDLSAQLIRLSGDEKNVQYVPAAINVVNYILEQLKELERHGKYNSFLGNKHWPVQQHSFFKSFTGRFSPDSTNQEILLNLMQDLAKKIADIKPEKHSDKALGIFIQNVSKQLTSFKASVHKDHDRTTAPKHFTFLSDFRKRHITEVKKHHDNLNQTINCA